MNYAYVEVPLPDPSEQIVTVEDIEKQTGGTVHYMSVHPFSEQTLIHEPDLDIDELLNQIDKHDIAEYLREKGFYVVQEMFEEGEGEELS